MKKILFIIATLFFINLMYVYLSYGFIISFEKELLYLFIGLSLLLLLLLIIQNYYNKKQSNKKLFLILSLLFISCLTFYTGEKVKDYVERRGKEKANQLISFIEDYKNDNNKFPTNSYLLKNDKIPKNSLMILPENYNYINDGHYFIITYNTFNGRTYSYSSNIKEWYYSD